MKLKTNFNFIFENTPFYYRDKMISIFNNADELEKYFDNFHKHYKDFDTFFSPLSKSRMKGKEIKNYTQLQKYSVKLADHYKILLTTGKNLYDIWLNDRIIQFNYSQSNIIKHKK